MSDTVTPIPDPTVLTTQNLALAIQSLDKLLSTRIDAVETSQITFQENVQRVPTQIDREISHLKELIQEKFETIALQFKERDTRVENTATLVSKAVDAALQAAKEAVGKQNDAFTTSISKSELATVKSIDSLATTLQVSVAAIDSKITDLKERMSRIESSSVAKSDNEIHQQSIRSLNQGSGGLIINVVIAAVAIVALLAALLKQH